VTVAGVNRWQYLYYLFFLSKTLSLSMPPPPPPPNAREEDRETSHCWSCSTCQINGRDAFTSLETSPGKPCQIIQVWGIFSILFYTTFISQKMLLFFFFLKMKTHHINIYKNTPKTQHNNKNKIFPSRKKKKKIQIKFSWRVAARTVEERTAPGRYQLTASIGSFLDSFPVASV
jgi:hypothetical protein